MQPASASAVMAAIMENRNARTTRTGAIPQSETALVLHRLWLTKRFFGRGAGERGVPPARQKARDQAATPAPVGHAAKAAIVGRILREVLLVIAFGKIEFARWRDL